MLLMELWERYLSKTMPVITAGGVPLLCVQMLGGIPSLIGLYQSVRRESAGERVLVCAVPGLVIVTFAIVEPMFFGSFLGDGFPWAGALKQFLYQPDFFKEITILAGAFLAAMAVSWLLQRRGGKFSSVRFLLSMGVGLAAAVVCLIHGADFFLRGGVRFLRLNDGQVKWLVYDVYLLIYQLCVTLICILWQLLFSERNTRGEEQNLERWLRRYLSQSSRVCGWGVLMYAAMWFVVVVKALYEEGSPYRLTLAVGAAMTALGVWLLARSFTVPDLKRIYTWGDPDETLYQLHQEIVLQAPIEKISVCFLTEHYLVMNHPKRIYCRALLEKPPERNTLGACVLHFQDGGKCRIAGGYHQILDPLLNGQAREARITGTPKKHSAWEYDE